MIWRDFEILPLERALCDIGFVLVDDAARTLRRHRLFRPPTRHGAHHARNYQIPLGFGITISTHKDRCTDAPTGGQRGALLDFWPGCSRIAQIMKVDVDDFLAYFTQPHDVFTIRIQTMWHSSAQRHRRALLFPDAVGGRRHKLSGWSISVVNIGAGAVVRGLLLCPHRTKW